MQKWQRKKLRRRGRPTGPATKQVAKSFGTRAGLGISEMNCPKRSALIDKLMRESEPK